LPERSIYVIGHRNPDTDSICSAIGYAFLKQASGSNAVAMRAGPLNPETRFVLGYFGLEPPELVYDLYPRVKDIMAPCPVAIKPGASLRELGRAMKEHGAKSVPVVDEEGMLVGIVSVGDLAGRYFEELEVPDLAQAGVDLEGIARVVDGRLLTVGSLAGKAAGKVWIGAARPETMRRMIGPDSIVFVGDREDAQLACIEAKVALLIVTGGAPVEEEVVAAANAAGVAVLSAPHDTYTCGRLVSQSVPVSTVMQREVIAFRPGDLVADVRETIVRTNHRNYPVVENGRLAGLINRDRLIVPEKQRVILVDHNELAQAVEGIEEARIEEIIDHHRLGGIETSEPIFIRHEPVGSTATIIANMLWHRQIKTPAEIAGILLAAIVSDTLLFYSPTATDKDRETARRLAAVAGLDVESFGLAVLKAGSVAGTMPPEEIAGLDRKEFNIGEYRLAISQVSVLDAEEVLALSTALLQALHDLREKKGYHLAMLMVTDIMRRETHLLYAGQAGDLLRRAYGQSGKDGCGIIYLPGVMSRKKQVLPPLVEAAKT